MYVRILFIASLLVANISCRTTASDSTYLAQGNQYAKDGLYKEAAESYRQALREQPKNMTIFRNLGMVLVKLGDFKKAVQSLEMATRSFGDDFDTNFYLAEAYRARDKYAEAIFRYKHALKVSPKSLKALKSLAWSYYQIRYYSEALNTARVAQKQAPNDIQSNVILARVYLSLGRHGDAQSVISNARTHATKESVVYIDGVEGDLYLEKNNCKKAVGFYQSALKAQPLLPSALLGLGTCMYQEKKYDLAINMLERASRLRPQMKETYLILGKTYEAKKDKKYLQYYKKFIAVAGNDPQHLSEATLLRKRMSQLN
ncbi:MAG: tetratricopeptide repeat protein [Oligoflexales bacterium]|nr:tetratricopeptide repeat protein [Oligoflexales bacterium]